MEPSIDKYAHFVRKIADTAYSASNVLSEEDLYQVGMVAAYRAIQTHNPTYGSTLNSYVKSCVCRAIYEEAAHFYGSFTLPKGVLRLAAQVNKQNQTILNTLSKEHIRDLLILYANYDYEDVYLGNLPTKHINMTSLSEILSFLKLSKNERMILKYRFLRRKSAKQLAKKLQISLPYLYQLESSVRTKIYNAVLEE